MGIWVFSLGLPREDAGNFGYLTRWIASIAAIYLTPHVSFGHTRATPTLYQCSLLAEQSLTLLCAAVLLVVLISSYICAVVGQACKLFRRPSRYLMGTARTAELRSNYFIKSRRYVIMGPLHQVAYS